MRDLPGPTTRVYISYGRLGIGRGEKKLPRGLAHNNIIYPQFVSYDN